VVIGRDVEREALEASLSAFDRAAPR